MLNWIITFFMLAVVAAVFGLGGMAGLFASIAKLLSIAFIALLVGVLVYGLISGPRANAPFLLSVRK